RETGAFPYLPSVDSDQEGVHQLGLVVLGRDSHSPVGGEFEQLSLGHGLQSLPVETRSLSGSLGRSSSPTAPPSCAGIPKVDRPTRHGGVDSASLSRWHPSQPFCRGSMMTETSLVSATNLSPSSTMLSVS